MLNKESVTGVEQKECAVEKLQHIGIGLEMDVMAHLVVNLVIDVYLNQVIFCTPQCPPLVLKVDSA